MHPTAVNGEKRKTERRYREMKAIGKSKMLCWLLVLVTIFVTACGNAQTQQKESEAETEFIEESGSGETEAGSAEAETKVEPTGILAKIRVGSLKGPTTMGIVRLMKRAENGETTDEYEFTMAAAADEIAAKLVSGDLDVALIPANLACVLYNKTEGKICVIDINTLGVLYLVTTDDSIHGVEDLAGKTVVTTGQGTTPEYALRTLLDRSGITDCTLEFKSEATEVAALLKDGSAQIAVLPQPFVTAAMMQNEELHAAFSLSEEWDRLSDDSRMVTGVTVVRTEFLAEHEDAVERFIAEHADSAQQTGEDVEGTAQLVAEYGIIEKAPVAAKAIPNCNIVCITGDEMKDALSGYLATLYEQNPQSVGGALPESDFYYNFYYKR